MDKPKNTDMIRWEDFPKCIFCGTEGKEVYHGLKDRSFNVEGKFNIKRCFSCGLMWLDPRPMAEDIHKCYENYFDHHVNETGSGTRGGLPALLKSFLRENVFCGHYGCRHLHKNHVFCKLGHLLAGTPILGSKIIYDLGARFPHFRPGGFIIDVGCGGGEYLKIMQGIGYNVLGVEPHPAAAGILENKGIPVLKGAFQDVGIKDSTADQITMHQVLEHMQDPIFAIEKCFRILKDGGSLITHMPNVDSLGHRVFTEDWFPLDPPRHMFVFSPKSVSILFSKSYFKKFRITTSSKNAKYIYDHSVLIEKNGKTNMGGVASQKGWRNFALKESLLCRAGRNCGEEIEIVAVK